MLFVDAMELHSDHLWAIVLAGGDGARLLPLTRALHGWDVPKQYARLAGRRSLLQATIHRVLGVARAERTVVVASCKHEQLARAQLASFRGLRLVLQPQNLGTLPGILLPLAHILAVDEEATVAIFPSDHHVRRPDILIAGVRCATAAVAAERCRLVLLGIVPDGIEDGYGWIVPGDRTAEPATSLRAVKSFREKPQARLAEELRAAGALWNSFIMVARAAELRALSSELAPAHAMAFDSLGSAAEGGSIRSERLEALYRSLPAGNFSTEVLERASGLGVVPVADSGWSDWGVPGRVLRSLRATGWPRDDDAARHALERLAWLQALAGAPDEEEWLAGIACAGSGQRGSRARFRERRSRWS